MQSRQQRIRTARRRTSLPVLLPGLTVLLLLGACAQPARPDLQSLLARRAFRAAAKACRARLDRQPGAADAARDLARVYERWHRYDSSLYWWDAALKLEPGNDSAMDGRWNSLYLRDEDDSTRLDRTRAVIRGEALALLAETTAASLTLAFDGLSRSDTTLAPAVGRLLTRTFPRAPRSYDIIGAEFYDSLYPIWRDDSLKVRFLRRFLDRFPATGWRTTAYTYLLSSLFELGDTTALLAETRIATDDDPDDPFRRRYAAAILNRANLHPEIAAGHARRAVELEPGFARPGNKPPEQWALEQPVLRVSARLALAEALLALDSLTAARAWLLDAVSGPAFDADLEATPGPCYTLLGETEEHLGDTAAATHAWVQALVTGDVRNRWTPRADSGLNRAWNTHGHRTIARARDLLEYGGARFTDVTVGFGLADIRGSRVAWGDYDGDGDEDLLVSGSRLFRNDSGAGFTEVTDLVGLAAAKGRGGIWADFDNDGRLDFYMPGRDTADRLWRNTGDGFEDVTEQAGWPSEPGPTEGCAWADFDNDGWVDLYAANYENWAEHSYHPDRLYHNRAGRFHDVTETAGITPPWDENRAGRGVAWADFDDDGFPDCFVANYRLQENLLWRNRGDSTFDNLAPELGIAGDEVDGWFGHTIGAAWGDYDNDGDLDLFTADLAHPRYIQFSNRSRLYENLGPDARPRFRDRRRAAGIRFEETHSNPAWGDIDNDGDLDLYITSIYAGRRSFLYENRAEQHGKPPTFNDITWLSGTRAFNGWGCAFADFDNDGDLDLVVGSGSGLRLFRNDTRTENHWLEVKVVGSRANRCGIGARVTLRQGRRRWIREVEGGSGTTSQSSLIQHFGLGPNPGPVDVEVRFGPGSVRRMPNLQPDQLVVVEEEPLRTTDATGARATGPAPRSSESHP